MNTASSSLADTLLALERAALDRWGRGMKAAIAGEPAPAYFFDDVPSPLAPSP